MEPDTSRQMMTLLRMRSFSGGAGRRGPANEHGDGEQQGQQRLGEVHGQAQAAPFALASMVKRQHDRMPATHPLPEAPTRRAGRAARA